MSADREAPQGEPNHLAGQTSPYLLQHLYNPVDWYPWGPAAHERARSEDKPIFLSIGYAACHWCHVMERESFEDADVAADLNRDFVSIKVDREERPDIDEIYMNAVQLLTGAGGWPLTVFLTPGLEPFFGGTYFPPRDSHGRPGFRSLLQQIRQAWAARRDDVSRTATELTQQLQRIAGGGVNAEASSRVGLAESARAAFELTSRFDEQWGGFGQAPKFPPDGALALLLREYGRSGEAAPLEMTRTTLDRMALGGMYDHVGGGFARYSVDREWLVPHFEKMLYNQALLVPVYTDAWLITGAPLYRRVVEQTLDFVRRELTGPEGGCYSSLDADSEGREGLFYVWSPEEVVTELGSDDGRLFCETYGITAHGNFEGSNIPNLLGGSLALRAKERGISEDELASRLDPLRYKLVTARERRVRPGTDDKILTAWNGLTITAFARAYQAFARAEDLASARRAADFVLRELLCDGRLRVAYRAGRAALNGYLDDYAFVARGLLDLYESGFDSAHLQAARGLAVTLLERFQDRETGGFYFTSDDHETLITRNRSLHDGALPSGAGVAAETLLRLAVLLDDDGLRQAALRTLTVHRAAVARMPSAHASMLTAADFAAGPVVELGLVGRMESAATNGLLGVIRGRYLPRRVVALRAPEADADEIALLRGKAAEEGRATAYVCRDYACRAPTTRPGELARLLDEGAS
jgi:uncharacterized protein YyaL (SSP411 family)